MKSVLKFNLVALLLHALTSHALTVTNIAQGSGAGHNLFLKSDGSLWAMGQNDYGQLGDGTSTLYRTNRPQQIVDGGVTAIAVGDFHSLFIKTDGSLWAMGRNKEGQLGDGTTNNINRPKQIVPGGVTSVAAGTVHSLFLKSDGSLWAMGKGTIGQLGDGTLESTNRPEQIVASGVTAIAAGAYHSLFIKSDGSLWAMGLNALGQLGDGTLDSTNRPEQIVASGATAIAAGFGHSLFMKSDGSLWAVGLNAHGQLGNGSLNNTNWPQKIVASGVTAIAAGADHSLFLKSDGSLWAMGQNYLGQLGDGTHSTNSLYGTNVPEQIIASGVTAIAAGAYHSLFLKSDGSLWGMGNDGFGQLGDGFSRSELSLLPEQIIPSPQPVLSSVISTKAYLQIKATCGFGGYFSLLTSTNINTPLSQWTTLHTSYISARGPNNFSFTNATTPGAIIPERKFYILRSQ